MGLISNWRHLAAGLLAAFLSPGLGWLPFSASAADRIILRNLELIADRSVVAIDDDGVQLDRPLSSGSSSLTWDEIERGRVSAALQAEFDRLHAELGPPLFKLRQRLRIGDYAGLSEPAEGLYPRYAERRSQTAYLVCQSLMWGRLAAGDREEGVEPLLRCVALLSSGAADANRLPGSRRLGLDPARGLCGDLPPIWLDAQAAQEALPAVRKLFQAQPAPRPPACYLYYASLAAAAGEFDEATKASLAEPGIAQEFQETLSLVRAQIDVEQKRSAIVSSELQQLASGNGSLASSLARYWQGRHLLLATDPDRQRDGLLSLLSIPAEDSRDQAELAAAAVHQAALTLDSLGQGAEAGSLRRELAANFGATALGIQSLSISSRPR